MLHFRNNINTHPSKKTNKKKQKKHQKQKTKKKQKKQQRTCYGELFMIIFLSFPVKTYIVGIH